ncbi:uncharacterized protein LOC120598844 [Pteropus medius]|uniref:uncharacterized protein LOC120598844 n=1 Tax=Pteropus vampyrus TaxID=132908 RepID=UPI00196AD1EF|nr:uncharacterized protein LOC120598844 [Pteropus giganteus]
MVRLYGCPMDLHFLKTQGKAEGQVKDIWCGHKILYVSQIGVWQPYADQVYQYHFSNSIYSLCVSVSHFLNYHQKRQLLQLRFPSFIQTRGMKTVFPARAEIPDFLPEESRSQLSRASVLEQGYPEESAGPRCSQGHTQPACVKLQLTLHLFQPPLGVLRHVGSLQRYTSQHVLDPGIRSCKNSYHRPVLWDDAEDCMVLWDYRSSRRFHGAPSACGLQS